MDVKARLFLDLADDALLTRLSIINEPSGQVECALGRIFSAPGHKQFTLVIQDEGRGGRTGVLVVGEPTVRAMPTLMVMDLKQLTAAFRQEEEGTVGFAIMFGNVGFMGYPVVASLFGHQAVFYAAVLNVINTFAVFTVGSMLITGKNEVEGAHFQKKVLYSTPMLAAYLTMAIVALRIDNIPEVISQPLTMLGDITVPAALLIIGSSMSQLSPRALLGNRTVYIATIMRLVVVPLALFFLFRAIGFSEMVNHINTVVIAMPVATYGTILCLRHGKDATLMTEVTFITTLLSMVTIPLLILLFP